MTAYFVAHKARLDRVIETLERRVSWSPFKESASPKFHGEEAPRAGRAAFLARLGKPFDLADQPGEVGRTGGEVSPFTGQPLGITYPRADMNLLLGTSRALLRAWAAEPLETRMGLCLEMVERLHQASFEIAHAVMHTAGQSFPMAFAGSGPNALDRGLEALAMAWRVMTLTPQDSDWSKAFGPGDPVRLHKSYRQIPLGPAVVISCATFPTWNAYPAMFVNLVTGNPVVVKPHPNCVLPMAIAVEICRDVLRAAGQDPNLVTMITDSVDRPIAQELVTHADVAIVDFTGSARFGGWIETNVRGKQVFTETSGVNTVVIQGTTDLDGMVRKLAHGLCLFSAQMCTSPQNIFVPKDGIMTDQGAIGFDELASRVAVAVDDLVSDPVRAAAILGAIQAESSCKLLGELRALSVGQGTIIRETTPYAHPEFPEARTATPLLITCDIGARDLYAEERFAPVGFFIRCADAEEALRQASADAKQIGAITAFLYADDENFVARAEDAFAWAGANLTINMTSGAMPINFSAAYSDLHVSGLNPAGNATLTDVAFVASRFRTVQRRRPF
ncbi:phenylacetic acid degradation protein PaaN [Govanella unica]|uniref:Phenylacetic acid degradation protein PaaN n=1 Tax=Govanella unica TaxID=2975056 RepID=A0A9X3TZN3_9PROT|nr:phenylacetic acid degradation protein PaaN [Govania unica]MDA5194728.1 phenylacetic acid degradation protein PaaN [Govania unica]